SGMSEPEIYEMLALRQKPGDLNELATAPDQGVFGKNFRDSFLSRITTQFGRNIGRQIGFDTFSYDPGEEGLRSSVTVGRTVSRDVLVKYRQAVGSGDPNATTSTITRQNQETPERALTVEYRLNQIFSLQGETGTLPQ